MLRITVHTYSTPFQYSPNASTYLFHSQFIVFLGNSYLSQLTGSDSYKLRVILTDTDGQSKYADYSHFKVDGPHSKYSLEISGYNGTAGNYLYCIM